MPVDKRHRWVLATTVLLALFIAFFALSPQPPQVGIAPSSDKVNHIIAFGVLVLPAALFFGRALVWAVPFALGLGGLIECIQPYVGRQGEVMDFVADCAGILLTVGIWFAVQQFQRRKVIN